MVKISLTKEECRQLLEMIEIASWVLGGHSDPPAANLARYEAVYQRMLSIIAGFASSGLVVADAQSGHFQPGPGFDDPGLMSETDE